MQNITYRNEIIKLSSTLCETNFSSGEMMLTIPKSRQSLKKQ